MEWKVTGPTVKDSDNPAFNPLISVIMPAYNHERFVEEAIRSVWDQSYPNLELVVINDGSTDTTAKVIETLRGSSPVPMKFLSKENEGICRTLNLGISIAKGDWIALLASDDKYSPEFISKNMEAAKTLSPKGAVLHCDAYSIDSKDVVLGKISERSKKPPATGDAFFKFAIGKCRIVSSTVVLPKKLMLEIGGYDENLMAEDFDMHLRVARLVDYHYIDEPLFFARYSPNSLGRSPWIWGDDIFTALLKHEDKLGDDLNRVLSGRARALFSSSIQYGSGSCAIKYWGLALHYSLGFWEKSKVLVILIGIGASTLARTILKKILPDHTVLFIRKILWSMRGG